ncbi:MAG TPA: Spy/CpxP family protein refolding chaperone [Xanthobacteraceae bacterium]|jgi:hypothetical protein|nr:Spy/CpxP family protein refolding chaperone [Xanthobacteraceae bacterium]
MIRLAMIRPGAVIAVGIALAALLPFTADAQRRPGGGGPGGGHGGGAAHISGGGHIGGGGRIGGGAPHIGGGARVGGGGAHFGAGRSGGGPRIGGGAHFGGSHVGAARIGGARIGGARIGGRASHIARPAFRGGASHSGRAAHLNRSPHRAGPQAVQRRGGSRVAGPRGRHNAVAHHGGRNAIRSVNRTRGNAANRRALRAAPNNARRIGTASPAGLNASPNTQNSLRAGRTGSSRPFFARNAPTSRLSAVARWRHNGRHRRGAFLAFYGTVFWPYAYTDIVDYTFWPYAYDDTFWDDAYDDVFVNVFAPGAAYAAIDSTVIGDTARSGGETVRSRYPSGDETGSNDALAPAEQGPPPADGRQANAAAPCDVAAPSITAWPFERIISVVKPNDEQQDLLNGVRDAAAKAGDALKAACPTSEPKTPPEKLSAAKNRLDAILHAVRTVRPPLEKFYAALNDEQKARFNTLVPEGGKPADRTRMLKSAEANATDCSGSKAGLTDWPIEQINDTVKPTDEQKPKLDALKTASEKAVAKLQSACPSYTPLTPTGRLEVTEKRLDAMVQAIGLVQPALSDFYAALDDAQKARFAQLGADKVYGRAEK